jgi:DNA-binding IclR family transcriptional regulator
MTAQARKGIKAVEVAAQILDRLARAPAPVALRELAAAGRMSPGKVHRYLASFLATGLACQDPETRKYQLGPLALQIGLAALSSYQPLRDAIALQHKLRDHLDETMVLSVWGTHGPTIIDVAESSQPIIMTMRVGAVLPMLATATGLAFAAFLPRHITKPVIRSALKAGEELNLFARDHAGVERLIAQVRAKGYAFNQGHLMPGISAAAFPLIDGTTTLVAVLAVMARDERLNPRDGAEIITYLRKAAASFGAMMQRTGTLSPI